MLYYRKLNRFDAPAFEGHLLALAPVDRRARFSGNVADESVRAYVAGIDWQAACLLGCFEDATLVGVAELHAGAGLPARSGEFAVTVATSHRNRGVGSELLRRTILLARNRMVGKLHMICLVDNQPMRRMADRFHSQIDVEDGQAWARLAVPFPDPVSLLSEALEDGIGFAAATMGAARGPRSSGAGA